jgi:hypothetical protein
VLLEVSLVDTMEDCRFMQLPVYCSGCNARFDVDVLSLLSGDCRCRCGSEAAPFFFEDFRVLRQAYEDAGGSADADWQELPDCFERTLDERTCKTNVGGDIYNCLANGSWLGLFVASSASDGSGLALDRYRCEFDRHSMRLRLTPALTVSILSEHFNLCGPVEESSQSLTICRVSSDGITMAYAAWAACSPLRHGDRLGTESYANATFRISPSDFAWTCPPTSGCQDGPGGHRQPSLVHKSRRNI